MGQILRTCSQKNIIISWEYFQFSKIFTTQSRNVITRLTLIIHFESLTWKCRAYWQPQISHSVFEQNTGDWSWICYQDNFHHDSEKNILRLDFRWFHNGKNIKIKLSFIYSNILLVSRIPVRILLPSEIPIEKIWLQRDYKRISNDSKKNSKRIPKEFIKNSKRIPKEFQHNSERIPKEFQKTSKIISKEFQRNFKMNSKLMPKEFQRNSKWIPT